MLKKNIGLSGRIIRFIVGIILLVLAIWLKSWLVFLFALFVFFEVYFSWCLVYQILGINACPKKKE